MNYKNFLLFLKKTNRYFWIFLWIILTALSLYFNLFFGPLFYVATALFLPGYLLAGLIIEKMNIFEVIALSVFLSMGLIAFSTLFLQTLLGFPLDRGTIVEASLLPCVILLGIHYVRWALQ
ncbi:MAG: hypothetical protein AB1467_06200 [Candidatus Diapherotrites archaeon]